MFRILLSLSVIALNATHAADPLAHQESNVSLRNEIGIAIGKGITFLKSQQRENGSWSLPEHPALTALPLIAIHRNPVGKPAADAAVLEKGYAHIRSCAKEDGGIYTEGLSNYNTAVSLMALVAANNPKDKTLLEKAHAFVVGQQASGMAKSELDGGIGYGPTGVSPKRQHPDMDNTLVAMEALRTYKAANEVPQAKDLNWKAAIQFLSRCQNLKASNDQKWASDDAKNRGGFVYYPGFSNAGEEDLPDGGKALRSYGSMTYAGLLSFIYADLDKKDPRVKSTVEWLNKNYTLEENPGMGRQGLYYYYHLMAKGLATAKVDTITKADGTKVPWKRDLGLKLMNLQNADGSWVNDTARWMEKDPVLTTSYCVMALEFIYHLL